MTMEQTRWTPDAEAVTTNIGQALFTAAHGTQEDSRDAFADLIQDFPESATDRDVASYIHGLAAAFIVVILNLNPEWRPGPGGRASAELGTPIPGTDQLDPTGAPDELELMAALMAAHANDDVDGAAELFLTQEPTTGIRATALLFRTAVALIRHRSSREDNAH